MDCAFQAPLSMGFPRQEHRSGVPLPSPAQYAIFFFSHCPLTSLMESFDKENFL